MEKNIGAYKAVTKVLFLQEKEALKLSFTSKFKNKEWR